MNKHILIGLIFSSLSIMATTVASDSNISQNVQETKRLVIDLDKEFESNNKGKNQEDELEMTISLGNNDEVSFEGNNTLMAKPITMEIKDSSGKSKEHFVNVYTLKTTSLEDGDMIVISNRRVKNLVKVKIQK